jgi:hypothetical protein
LVQEERKGTFFVQVEQNGITWWQPVNVDIRFPLEAKWINKNYRFNLNQQIQLMENYC